jgi:anti-anti-sigma factor
VRYKFVATTPRDRAPDPGFFAPHNGADILLGTYDGGPEIDLATGDALLSAVRGLVDRAEEAVVVVDCSEFIFMDSAAFHALVAATEYAARRGHTLVIRNLAPSCARVIRLFDFERELRITS